MPSCTQSPPDNCNPVYSYKSLTSDQVLYIFYSMSKRILFLANLAAITIAASIPHVSKRFDPCVEMDYGVDRYDCLPKDGHVMTLEGTCPLPLGTACASYCEVRRTKVLGKETRVEGLTVDRRPPGTESTELQFSFTATTAMTVEANIGVAIPWRDIFSAGVGFSC
jgi:hypothetical protein